MSRLKSTHMAHHYKDCDYSFGITNTFFDRVFRTKPGTAGEGGGIGGGGGGVGGLKAKAL
jgi:sterol desaturase/sphingolipid hydroxylase (fatty acid hydroxylase superfamily)